MTGNFFQELAVPQDVFEVSVLENVDSDSLGYFDRHLETPFLGWLT